MWELDYKESWVLKNWCFWTQVLEKTLESPLDCKEIQPVHPKGNQSWVFIGRTDAEAETPVLWTPHTKSWLIGKDPDGGRDSTHASINVKAKKSTNHTLVYNIIALSWIKSFLSQLETHSKRHDCLSQREKISTVLHIGRTEYFWANLYYSIIVNINFESLLPIILKQI